MLLLLLLLGAFSSASEILIESQDDNIFQIYKQYYKMLKFITISRIHCYDEKQEQYETIEWFSDNFIKQFSEIKKHVAKFYTSCHCNLINTKYRPILVDDVSPKLRTQYEISSNLNEVSHYNLGTVIISWAPNFFCDRFQKELQGYKRSLYLLIFTQKNISEPAIWHVLQRCWQSMKILNIIIHAPLSSEKIFIYIYDPFYKR